MSNTKISHTQYTQTLQCMHRTHDHCLDRLDATSIAAKLPNNSTDQRLPPDGRERIMYLQRLTPSTNSRRIRNHSDSLPPSTAWKFEPNPSLRNPQPLCGQRTETSRPEKDRQHAPHEDWWGAIQWRRPGSNRQPPPCKGGALPIELRPPPTKPEQVGVRGLEPRTSALSELRSNHLSYTPRVGERYCGESPMGCPASLIAFSPDF